METTLKNRIDEIKQQAETLISGHMNQTIIGELRQLNQDLSPEFSAVALSLEKRKLLKTRPEEFELTDFLENEKNCRERMQRPYASLKASFDEAPERTRQDPSFSQFISSIKNYRTLIDTNNDAAWKKWLRERKQESDIADAELESIKNIPKEKKGVDQYRKCKQKFYESQTLPSEQSKLEEKVQLANRLKELKDAMNLNRPPKVTAFYNKLGRDDGVQLSELDKEIYKWLKDNDDLSDLIIKRRESYPRGRW
jgi:hypothetical protein